MKRLIGSLPALFVGIAVVVGAPPACAAGASKAPRPAEVIRPEPSRTIGVVGGVRYFQPSFLNLRRGDWTSGLTGRTMEDLIPSLNGAYGGMAVMVDANNAFYALGSHYRRSVSAVFEREFVGSSPSRELVHTITRAEVWSVELDWRRYRDRTTRFRPYLGLGLAYGEVKTDLADVGTKFIGLPSYTAGLLLKPIPGLAVDINLKTDTRFVVPMNGTAALGLSYWFGER